MSVDHNDPEVQKLFDIELAAQRAALVTDAPTRILSEADRDYMIGIAAAIDRAPTEQQVLERDLAARCTVDAVGNIKLPDDTPGPILDTAAAPCSVADRIKLRVLLTRRAQART